MSPETDPAPRRPPPPPRTHRRLKGLVLNPRHARVATPLTETQIATGDQRARGRKL